MDGRRFMTLGGIALAALLIALGAGGCGGGGGLTFSGTVVVDDQESTPVPDARVVVGGVLTQTDAEGKFRASDPVVNADETVYVSVSKSGYRGFDQAVKTSSSPVIRLQPRALTEYGRVTGRVVDVTTSKGIGRAEVQIQPLFGGEISDEAEIQFTHTASDGSFEVTGFPGGNGRIIAKASGYLTEQVPISIEVGDPPPEPNPYTIAMTPTTERLDVEGIVTELETGTPLSGISVRLAGVSATTRSDGTFTVIGVPAGPQTVVVNAEGYDPYSASVTVEADMALLRIALSRSTPAPGPPANVRGTVTLQGQSNASGATVVALGEGGREVDRATTPASGAYGLLLPAGAVPASRVRLGLHAPGADDQRARHRRGPQRGGLRAGALTAASRVMYPLACKNVAKEGKWVCCSCGS
jgi:hypothetical protein